MKKLLILLAATAAFSLLPSLSQASCVASGTIPRVSITSAVTTLSVRLSGAAATTFNFTTTNASFINAALVAQSSHSHVLVLGNAAACGPVTGGISAGGDVVSIIVSP